MENKDYQVLNKIYHHIDSILNYCEDCETLSEFQQNDMRVESCVFNMLQIGELAKAALSDEAKNQISTIPWKQIYGMRNRIVHGYEGVEMKVVWTTIREDLPLLKAELYRNLNEKNCV